MQLEDIQFQRQDGSRLHMPLLRHLMFAIETGHLTWGESLAGDWVAMLDSDALGAISTEDLSEDGWADLIGVTLTLLLMEMGASGSTTLSQDEIEDRITRLLVMASVEQLSQAGLFQIEGRMALTETDKELEMRLSDKGLYLLKAGWN